MIGEIRIVGRLVGPCLWNNQNLDMLVKGSIEGDRLFIQLARLQRGSSDDAHLVLLDSEIGWIVNYANEHMTRLA